MALHEQSVGASDEWYTPPYVFEALGCTFDMDVASPGFDVTPWVPAKTFICKGREDVPWRGFIWMNPPFGGRNGLVPWLERFVAHGNGICLVPDRTSAPWWQQFMPLMDLTLQVSGKIKFIPGSGQKAGSPAQGTTLGAIGRKGVHALLWAERAKLGTVWMRPSSSPAWCSPR